MARERKFLMGRLIIEICRPSYLPAYSEYDARERFHKLDSEIKRHCDLENTSEFPIYDPITQEVCSYCGAQWTEGDSSNNGGCCPKDAEVYTAEELGEKKS